MSAAIFSDYKPGCSFLRYVQSVAVALGRNKNEVVHLPIDHIGELSVETYVGLTVNKARFTVIFH